jgi:hypothetical protein
MTDTTLCGTIVIIVFAVFLSYMRDVDKDNMDSYDRYYGVADEGRSRGMFGTIYDAEGNVDTWRTLSDPNPFWH